MTELTKGERQRREVNTYNLFYSAITPRASPSLASYGVRIPVMFPVIADRSEDVHAEPDFVLYDGETCLLCEIKSGNNINIGDIRQMRECASVTIEMAEEALKAAQVREKTGYHGSVSNVESIIIYQDLNEDYLQDTKKASDDFREALDQLIEHCVVMTQDYGGELRVLAGEFKEDGQLQHLLDDGIELPRNPPDEVMLTEAMEKEILAIAICDIWGEKAVNHEDGEEVTRTQVRDYFAPRHNVDIGDLDLVFRSLVEFGACDRIEANRYKFTREHMPDILAVESFLMDTSVADFIHGPEQASIDDDF